MAFQDTFIDLRARRRIPMRLFKDRAGIHPSYIHGIEQEGVIPSEEKLALLASVFVEVAEEQEAVDPQADARRLMRERDLVELERLRFDPEFAEAILLVREMDARERSKLMAPLRDGLAVYASIDEQERGGAAKMVRRIRALIEGDEESRNQLASELAELVDLFLSEREGGEGRPLTATPASAPRTPA